MRSPLLLIALAVFLPLTAGLSYGQGVLPTVYEDQPRSAAFGAFADGRVAGALVCEAREGRAPQFYLWISVLDSLPGGPADYTYMVGQRRVAAELEVRIDGQSFKPVNTPGVTDGAVRLLADMDRNDDRLLWAMQTGSLLEIVGDDRTLTVDLKSPDREKVAAHCVELLGVEPPGSILKPAKPQGSILVPAPKADDPEPKAGSDFTEGEKEAAAAFNAGDYGYALGLYIGMAAMGNHPFAYDMIGYIFDEGLGVEADPALAMKYYRRAADLGEANAMLNIGALYERGSGVAADQSEAAGWFLMAAKAGSPKAKRLIADMLVEGRGVVQDYALALSYYEEALGAGELSANWGLAQMHALALGTRRDTYRAADFAFAGIVKGSDHARDQIIGAGGRDMPRNFIARMQELLRDGGFYIGPIDGDMGPGTRAAIERAFGSDR